MDSQIKSETQIINNKTETVNGGVNYAGFFIRLMARFCDILILFFPTLIYFSFTNLGQIDLKGLIIVLIWYILIFWIFGWIISIFYTSYLTFRYGGTLGKMIAGISVFDEKGAKLTFTMSLFRHTIGYAASGIFFALGYLWIIKDPKKQGWHDHLTGSLVRVINKSRFVVALLFVVVMLIVEILLGSNLIGQARSNQNLISDFETMKEFYEKNKEPIQIPNITPANDISPSEI